MSQASGALSSQERTVQAAGSVTPTVAIIGAGASGTLAAAHLARAVRSAGRRIAVLLMDPTAPGRGVAYSTTDPLHRLNVPAVQMSAWPHDPLHFVRWMRRNVAAGYPEHGYAPRVDYGRYLADVLAGAVRSGVSFEHVPIRATSVRPHGRRYRISLADGTSRAADVVVLALGHGEPTHAWAPPVLRRSARFVPDPWCVAGLPPVRAGEEVLLVGAGLTAVDMAMSSASEAARVHVVSRHGLSPLPHAKHPQPHPQVPVPTRTRPRGDADLGEVRRFVFDAIRDADGDWRRAVDGLRHETAALWQAMTDDARSRFLDRAARRWDRVRHRIDPAVHALLEQRRAEGLLIDHRGAVLDAETDGDDRLRVTLSDGTVVNAAAVINCTGAAPGVRSNADPLVMHLLASGLARASSPDLGFATDERGRVLAASGEQHEIWALGPLRKGQLWESTAIPEIRTQAAALARDIVAALPDPGLRRRPRDLLGLPISAQTAAAARYNDALSRILRVEFGAEEALAQAVRLDPDFALGHAVRALLGVEWGADVDVAACLAAAQAPGARADERERRFVELAAQRVTTPGRESAAALLSYIDAYPEDALAVSIAVPTIAFNGATELPAEAWALVDGLAPAYGDHWWYQGIAAFMRQEQERYDEAAALAARALAVEPASGHAAHAKAHVHYETGDHRAGLTWLDRWIKSNGAAASHRAHFSWHAALHELSLGEYEAMAARYAQQLAPPRVSGVRALVDSASLLWRARAGGLPPSTGGVAAVLATVPAHLLYEPPTPFIALHAAVALAASDDCTGLARLRRYAESSDQPALAETIGPLADALADAVHGDFEVATDRLLTLSGVDRLGGSAAQREVVEDTLIYCAVQARRHDEAHAALTQRIERRASPHDRARRTAVEIAASGVGVRRVRR